MIRLSDLLDRQRIIILQQRHKQEALDEMVDLLGRDDRVHDVEALRRSVHERESIMSTGVGFGIAVPHAKADFVDDLVLAIGVSTEGIDFASLDDQPVHIIVMIAANSDQQDKYIRTLARVMLLLKNPQIRMQIASAHSPDDVLDILQGF